MEKSPEHAKEDALIEKHLSPERLSPFSPMLIVMRLDDGSVGLQFGQNVYICSGGSSGLFSRMAEGLHKMAEQFERLSGELKSEAIGVVRVDG